MSLSYICSLLFSVSRHSGKSRSIGWYYLRMREGPRPPKKKEEDIEAEAVLGHRIEQWDILSDTTLPIAERKEKLIDVIQREADTLAERQDELTKSDINAEDMYDLQIDELYGDIEDIEGTENSQEALNHLIDAKKDYYKSAKEIYKRL
jgi:hypothetical protein